MGLGAIVAVMVGLSFAAVPFYDWFCRVTGFGGTTAVDEAGPDGMLDRTVTVRFDANTAPDLPWAFRPMTRTLELRIGETALVFYEAENLADAPVAGSASFNVAPYAAGGYFTKIACFCFEMQVLAPGERIEMPVTFYVDPAMVDDPEAGGLTHVTLSYTMHRAELPEQAASLPQPRYAAATAQ
jgi:cytochrome c oxidase assembly protein subunit 11